MSALAELHAAVATLVNCTFSAASLSGPAVRTVALRGGELVRQDGDEYEVIDAEHQLQHNQGQQAEPCRGVNDPFHGLFAPSGDQYEGRGL